MKSNSAPDRFGGDEREASERGMDLLRIISVEFEQRTDSHQFMEHLIDNFIQSLHS